LSRVTFQPVRGDAEKVIHRTVNVLNDLFIVICISSSNDGHEKPLCIGILGEIQIDYFIESAPYGFLFTSRKTLETNE